MAARTEDWEEEEDWENADTQITGRAAGGVGGDDDDDDWEALVDGDDGADKVIVESAGLSVEEMLNKLDEALVIDTVPLSRAAAVAAAVKIGSSNASKECIFAFMHKIIKLLGENILLDDLDRLKNLTGKRIAAFTDHKLAAERAAAAKDAPAIEKKKKKKKKKKKSQVYSNFDESGDETWNDLDDQQEAFVGAMTHKSSKNWSKGDW